MLRGKYFRNSLALILVISSIPGLIVGGVIYGIAGGWLEQALLQLHKSQIVQRASNVDDQFAYMETSLAHWAFDPKFNSNLYETLFYRDFEIARDITKTLNVMQGSTPLAKNVELYLSGPQSTRFHPEYDAVTDKAVEAMYQDIFTHDNMAFWMQLAADPTDLQKQSLALVHKIPGVDTHPFGAVIVRINEDKAANLLTTLTPYNVGETFVMQSDGNMLLTSSKNSDSASFNEVLKQEVVSRGGREGSFLFDYNKNMYTVSYGTLQRIGTEWMYVSASPISAITEPVDFVSKLILSASAAALLLALILSWYASRKIYSPVRRLVALLNGHQTITNSAAEHHDEFTLIEKQWVHLSRESNLLQSKLEEQLEHVREGFLLQLIQGFLYSYSEEDLRERMRGYGWEVDGKQFIVMHVQLTGLANLEGRFTQGDEGLITFAAANMVEELSSSRLSQADVINFHDLSLGLLIMLPSEEEYKEALYELSSDIVNGINKILKLQVSIIISKPATAIDQIPSFYEEAKQASGYRNFVSENQIMDLESIDTAKETNEQRYPFALEREIVQAIRTGQQPEAEALITSFLDALLERGAKEMEVQQSMLQLLFSIFHAIRQLGMDPNQLFGTANMYEQFTSLREPDKMLGWFSHKIIRPFVRELEARSDVQLKKVVETAKIYLQQRYMQEISLDTCADYTGMNAVALSKAFKQVTGINFIDYLTELRMDKAKELLRDTEHKINDIAVQVGYQHSYFNRIFKKHTGFTPSQYRDMHRI
ncbi:helix-turn-helix domain-containing protein [Paenibacillus sp. H1-7]|uniref:helix-turn-helix domain-containing protein n=1 Tax=Paenibacillus sp. H1-7 TaxID=2282849 RepID=UPI001EF924E8|nr:helix-turn-helix domain-containing protein [Paenibacillus sp. H1-7]